MPASAPKGWFKRWAFGFGLAGWILLGVLALMLVACWRGWDPIYGLEWLAARSDNPEAPVLACRCYAFVFADCGATFGVVAATLMVAGAATSRRPPSCMAALGVLLASVIWPFRIWLFQSIGILGYKPGVLFYPFTDPVSICGGVLLLAFCAGALARSIRVALMSGFVGILGWLTYLGWQSGPSGSNSPVFSLEAWRAFIVLWHIAVLWVTVHWAASTHRESRPGTDCPSCGYDLTGISNPKCPEGGTQHAAAQPAPST